MFRSILGTGLALLLLAFPASAFAQGISGCQFQLGFATIAGLIPTQVGVCVEAEAHSPQNGDALQHTSGGLLVWRKSDNWTAFTDGFHSWINGPTGLQSRLNSQRFSWEANPAGLPVVGGSPAPIIQAAAATPVPQSIGAKLPSAIGTSVNFTTLFNHTPFHGVVVDAYETQLLPTVYYPNSQSVSHKAIPAPGNSMFVVLVMSLTNIGTVSDSVYGNEFALRDVQGRTFTSDQTPNDADFAASAFFGTKGLADSLGPSLTDKFTVVFVVSTDATGLRPVPVDLP